MNKIYENEINPKKKKKFENFEIMTINIILYPIPSNSRLRQMLDAIWQRVYKINNSFLSKFYNRNIQTQK